MMDNLDPPENKFFPADALEAGEDMAEAEMRKLMDDQDAGMAPEEGIAFPTQTEKFGLKRTLVNGFIPFVVFNVTSLLLMSHTRHRTPYGFPIFTALCGAASIWPLWSEVQKERRRYAEVKRKSLLYLLPVCTIAFCIAVFWGNWLYQAYSAQYFEYIALKWNVNPIAPKYDSGALAEDAGVMVFSEDSKLDRAHGGCYKIGETYCVAPVVEGTASGSNPVPSSNTGTYDYFAVGKGCCSCPEAGDFSCGDYMNPTTLTGGLRLLDATERTGYHMAVQQWSAKYGLAARRPIFFEWVNEPFKKIRNLDTDRWGDMFTASVISLFVSYTVAISGFFLKCF